MFTSVAPASMRESSRRSITIESKRRTWPTTTSRACWVRSGRSAAADVEHLDGGGQRGDRRAQLVADVGGEALLAFDPFLDGVGHVVERAGEPVEVGVVLLVEPGVEAAGRRSSAAASATRDSGRSSRRLVDHPKKVATQRGEDRSDDQRRREHLQRAFGGVERERLEVRGVVGLDPHADREVRLAVGVGEALDTPEILESSDCTSSGGQVVIEPGPALVDDGTLAIVDEQDHPAVGVGLDVEDRVARRRPDLDTRRVDGTGVRDRGGDRRRLRWSSRDWRANRNVVAVSAMPPSSAVTAKNSVTRVLRRSGRRSAMGGQCGTRRCAQQPGSEDGQGAHAAAAGEAPGGGRHLTGAA